MVAAALGCISTTLLAQNDYVVGPQDVLAITVFDHDDLSGSYEVAAGGTLAFPLIGRVEAAGLTLRELETAVAERLAEGYLRHPQVAVAVAEYRSQEVFVLGEVRSPGTYPFAGQMTLIEALARAGSATRAAGNEVLVIRRSDDQNAAGTDDDAVATDEIIRVDLSKLHQGSPDENVILLAGDMVIVQQAELVYVFGHVASPGGYPFEPNTTVLQALSLAGGVTDRGATGRIDILRKSLMVSSRRSVLNSMTSCRQETPSSSRSGISSWSELLPMQKQPSDPSNFTGSQAAEQGQPSSGVFPCLLQAALGRPASISDRGGRERHQHLPDGTSIRLDRTDLD